MQYQNRLKFKLEQADAIIENGLNGSGVTHSRVQFKGCLLSTINCLYKISFEVYKLKIIL